MICKVRRSSECSTGNHHFTVTRWLVANGQQAATEFRCMKCLASFDRAQIAALEEKMNEEDLHRANESSSPGSRSKSSKGSSGGEQKAD